MADTEQLQRRAQEIEAQGQARVGQENWAALVGAVTRARPTNEQVANTLASPNAVDEFLTVGRTVLLKEMQSGDKEAEITYGSLRDYERERHRRLKGRD